MDKQLKARLGWVNLYLETKNSGHICLHCGISRPTLRKWVTRYQNSGLAGLKNLSKKPKSSPNKKATDALCALVLALREERNLGARRIQSELKRLHETEVSLATIHKILINQKAHPIKKLKRKKKFIRYQRPIPGDRIQIDTCKIAPYGGPQKQDSNLRYIPVDKGSIRNSKNEMKNIHGAVQGEGWPRSYQGYSDGQRNCSSLWGASRPGERLEKRNPSSGGATV